MLIKIFMYLNVFIVLFVAGTMMFSDFKPDTFRKLIYLAAAIIFLPVTAVGIANLMGSEAYWISDLLFMRGGGIGIPVTFGYGIALGLMLNKLRRLVTGDGKSTEKAEEPKNE